MQLFGILSLLITIALAAMWLTSGAGPAGSSVDENGGVQESSYKSAIDAAQEAADSMGE